MNGIPHGPRMETSKLVDLYFYQRRANRNMRTRSIMTVMLSAPLGALLLPISTAHAHTGNPPLSEENMACFGDFNGTSGYVASCFEGEGDDFWVKDNEPDGDAAVVYWEVPELGRYGWCVNSHGYGNWHECTYDFAEGYLIEWEHMVYDGDGVYYTKSGPYRHFT